MHAIEMCGTNVALQGRLKKYIGVVPIAGIEQADMCLLIGTNRDESALFIGPHPENLTMNLPCRVVLGSGQRRIEVVGPLLEAESRAVHEGFWT